MPPKPKTYVTDELGSGKDKTLAEIGTMQPVEQVHENDFFDDELKLEAFMNEVLEVEVHDSDKEGDLEIIAPCVNGVNQPIVRGVPQKIKRKYVEALARSLITTQVQKIRDLNDPTSLVMNSKSVVSYPFTVINDPNPNGRPWLKAIIAAARADAAR